MGPRDTISCRLFRQIWQKLDSERLPAYKGGAAHDKPKPCGMRPSQIQSSDRAGEPSRSGNPPESWCDATRVGWLACLLPLVCLGGVENQLVLSSPLGAAKSYFSAMAGGDAKAMASASIGSSSQRACMVELMRSCLACEELDQAATARFGRETTDNVFGETKRSFALMGDTLAGLTNCALRVEGTNATIHLRTSPTGGGLETLNLQQTAGDWRVVLEPIMARVESDAALMKAQAKSMQKCAADIRAGKYKSAEQAHQAMVSDLVAQYLDPTRQQSSAQPSAQTNPAVKPSGAPASH